MDAKVVTAPTEGDWKIVRLGLNCSIYIGDVRVAVLLPENLKYGKRIVSACNSYQRHFSDPVAAAESDWIARAVEALKECLGYECNLIDPNNQTDLYREIDALLSQVREVK